MAARRGAARCSAIAPTQGRRYSWGYPAVPEQSEHLKVDRLLDLAQIGMTITDGYAPDPEQSTLALVAHHPQAIYFGTRQGRLPAAAHPTTSSRGSPATPRCSASSTTPTRPRSEAEDEERAGAGRLGHAAGAAAVAARRAGRVTRLRLRPSARICWPRERLGEVEALAEVAVDALQLRDLAAALDALGDRLRA